jgi:hypothetical protein
MLKALIRCNEGHYFDSEHCPFDGWSSLDSKRFKEIITSIHDDGSIISFEELKKRGAPGSVTSRMIIIDFGESNFLFDAFSADGYFINGEHFTLQDLAEDFL